MADRAMCLMSDIQNTARTITTDECELNVIYNASSEVWLTL